MEQVFGPSSHNLELYIDAIRQLADCTAELGHYGLQDACLLITDNLEERYQLSAIAVPNALWQLLNNLPNLVSDYIEGQAHVITAIIALVSHPGLAIPLTDEEFSLLEEALRTPFAQGDTDSKTQAESVALNPQQTFVNHSDMNGQLNGYIIQLEQFANQSAGKGQYGLQDACLLLADALQAHLTDDTTQLAALLDGFLQSFVAYQRQQADAIEDIMALLRQPILQLPITGEELAILQTALELEFAEQPQLVVDTEVAATIADRPIEPEQPGLVKPLATTIPQDLLSLLQLEGQHIQELLGNVLSGELSAALESLQDELLRYGNAAHVAGFQGLANMFAHIQANLGQLVGHNATTLDTHHSLLQGWIGLVQVYLQDLEDDSHCFALISHLSDGRWVLPLAPEQAALLLAELRHPNSIPEENTPKRPETATLEDVSLTLPEDVNQQLLAILLQELPAYTREFSETVQNLHTTAHVEDLNVAQRIAHTLKGSANTVGISGIANLTHHLEDILEACTKANNLPSNNLLATLQDAADCLEAMSDYLTGLQTQPPPEAQHVLQQVLDYANRIDEVGLDADMQLPLQVPDDQTININAEPTTDVNQAVAQAASIKVAAEQIDDLLRLSGESLILNTQAAERLRRIKVQLVAMDNQFRVLQELGDELQELIDIRDLSGQGANNVNEFDALEMDQYNELHTTSRRLIEAAVDIYEMNKDARSELGYMAEILDYQQRVVIDTQAEVMKTRLLPVASIIPRLQRTLRQTCRMTGKHCELSFSGQHHLIDTVVLNSMADPLMHILRNAIDHGIEDADTRLALGKDSTGQIRIEFDREGNDFVVRCHDDGKGLDYGAIRQTAERCGLLQESQAVTEEELKRFILRPSFSTRTESTQTSGRGVGMNAVYYQIQSQGGNLVLHSVAGQGLSIELKLPLPISRSHTLLASAGTHRVAITSKGLNQVVYVPVEDFSNQDGQTLATINEQTYPTTSLNQLLHMGEGHKKNLRHIPTLLIQHDGQTSAVTLEQLMDSLDIVIKDFGHYVKKIPGYIGAAILGDGTVAPVLDLPELLRLSSDSSASIIETVETIDPALLLPKVLVVDDSLSQRRSLEQLLVDAGFAVYVARDGIEAVELLADVHPDAVLTDLEMPRMNGIELSSHIRGQSHLKDLPIIMITSRTTQKHRALAESVGINFYIAKPVREDDLLEKIYSALGTQQPVANSY